jgi:hypothetical protein
VFGETWTLPVGILAAVGASALVRAVAGTGGWWHEAGGWLLLGLLVVAFAGALARPR